MVLVSLFLIKHGSKPLCTVFHGRGCRMVGLQWRQPWQEGFGHLLHQPPEECHWINHLPAVTPQKYLQRAFCAGHGAVCLIQTALTMTMLCDWQNHCVHFTDGKLKHREVTPWSQSSEALKDRTEVKCFWICGWHTSLLQSPSQTALDRPTKGGIILWRVSHPPQRELPRSELQAPIHTWLLPGKNTYWTPP